MKRVLIVGIILGGLLAVGLIRHVITTANAQASFQDAVKKADCKTVLRSERMVRNCEAPKIAIVLQGDNRYWNVTVERWDGRGCALTIVDTDVPRIWNFYHGITSYNCYSDFKNLAGQSVGNFDDLMDKLTPLCSPMSRSLGIKLG